jgi:hypothetical protein
MHEFSALFAVNPAVVASQHPGVLLIGPSGKCGAASGFED